MQPVQTAELTCREMSKVLLVADADWVINEVRSALALGDWDVEVVSDSRTVTDSVEKLSPEAVIVDLQVGSMGGMAIVRAIRQTFEGDARPRTVLLLDRSADDFIARRAGADARVLKPITSSVLRAALSPEPAMSASEEE